MKRLNLLITIFVGMSLGFLSCGYGGPGGGGTPECQAHCMKNKECCDADEYCDPWDDYKMEECLCDCGNFYRIMTDAALRGLKDCNNLPCGETPSNCMDNLMIGCAGAVTPAVDAFCTRVDDCSQDSPYAQCVQIYSSIINCYSAKTQDAMLACSSVGTCETFDTDFEECMAGRLGIMECDLVDY